MPAQISSKRIFDGNASSIEYSILVLGLDNAGKTTLLEQIKALYNAAHEPKLNTVPTVGQNVSLIDLPDCYLRIWDVGGQHSLRSLWQSYYSSCHAIVFVIDSSDVGDGNIEPLQQQQQQQLEAEAEAGQGQVEIEDGPRSRLEECRLVLEDVLHNEDAEGVPILVLANKQDREDCVEVVRIKEGLVRKVFEGDKGQNVRDSRVLPLSALTGTGVREAVEWVCSRVKWNKEGRPPVMR
ncbi:putative ADP-ribosylation factor [Polychaeton citri CBS 116435]|uniref:ADP-ribosylation factor n=1 Tax=Polychaeton citri CBS 116435 TaxID=1314669 RepID=A0A9P4QH03_9PEZI|nr:putative ADP-ribosylation factor [Polychaeton citri CBS 116435]